MNIKNYKVSPNTKVNLSKFPTGFGSKKIDKVAFKASLQKDIDEISNYQYKLYAEDRQSLLIILQGMDASGKDSTIKHIMHGVNPQGVLVHSFKHPSTQELEHDYLWRHVQKLPEHGQITIFNRSHYENVLIAKVHPEIVLAERLPGVFTKANVDQKFWKNRYKQINNFEKNIIQNGTHVLKFFLHLSKKEQAKRFIERIDEKEEHWKFSPADLTERGFWDDYQLAYEQALMNTSTKKSPWYIIPADDKDYTHQLIGRIILEKLKEINPQFPPISKAEADSMALAKKSLLKEFGK
jgi:PPK2 family polyphosphate:nucleotide phosphotransferase